MIPFHHCNSSPGCVKELRHRCVEISCHLSGFLPIVLQAFVDFMPGKEPRDRSAEDIRSFLDWVRRFIAFHTYTDPIP